MSDDLRFSARITADGKLELDDKLRFRAAVTSLSGQRVEVELHRRKRSGAQNRFYHAVVVRTLADYTGYTTDEMHEALKAKFLAEDDMVLGLTRITSTTKLSTAQMTDYIERVRLWAHCELGCYIPAPNEDERGSEAA
jgi:azurin